MFSVLEHENRYECNFIHFFELEPFYLQDYIYFIKILHKKQIL